MAEPVEITQKLKDFFRSRAATKRWLTFSMLVLVLKANQHTLSATSLLKFCAIVTWVDRCLSLWTRIISVTLN